MNSELNQNPRVGRVPPGITLQRGRTEPLAAGRTEVEGVVLAVEVCVLPEEGLLLEDGLVLVDGLLPVDEGEVLVFGAEGFSVAGGTFACATGSPPPLYRL